MSMLETKQRLIKKFTETQDDQLVIAAINKLANEEISLKSLVDDF
jgi:hypothetical protein